MNPSFPRPPKASPLFHKNVCTRTFFFLAGRSPLGPVSPPVSPTPPASKPGSFMIPLTQRAFFFPCSSISYPFPPCQRTGARPPLSAPYFFGNSSSPPQDTAFFLFAAGKWEDGLGLFHQLGRSLFFFRHIGGPTYPPAFCGPLLFYSRGEKIRFLLSRFAGAFRVPQPDLVPPP